MNGSDNAANPDLARLVQQGHFGSTHPFLQHQQQQPPPQQLAAAAQLASGVVPLNAGGTNVNNLGSAAGLSYQLDAVNAAKQMAALQAAGRSRALSHTAPTSQATITPSGNGPNQDGSAGIRPASSSSSTLPATAQQQQQQQQQHPQLPNMADPNIRAQVMQAQHQLMAVLLQTRPPNFLPQLAEFMATQNAPLPPALTGVQTPNYDPATSRARGIMAGSTLGTFHLYGKEVDLHTLLIWIIQRGGGVKNQSDDTAWESFLDHIGLSRLQASSSLGQPPTDLVPVLKSHYVLCLYPFESHWIKFIQQRALMNVRQHQQQMALQQAIASNGGQPINPQQMQTLVNNNHQTFGAGMTNGNPPQGNSNLMQQQQFAQQQQQQQHAHALQMQQHARQAANGLPQGQQQHQQQQPQHSPVQQPHQNSHIQQAQNHIAHSQQPSSSPVTAAHPSNSPQTLHGGFGAPSHMAQQQQQQHLNDMMPGAPGGQFDSDPGAPSSDINGTAGSNEDFDSRKRKSEDSDDIEGKRPRMEDAHADPWTTAHPPTDAVVQSASHGFPPQSQPSSPTRTSMNGTVQEQPSTGATSLSPTEGPRSKVLYRPLSRPLNTYGGRNLIAIERERAGAQARRTIRTLDEWGEIDMEGINLSIRSRLSVEMSYALTTLTMLSAFIGRDGSGGFPLDRCGDLVSILLDLLEEVAFEGLQEEKAAPEAELRMEGKAAPRTWTHQDLIKAAREGDGSGLFAAGLGFNMDTEASRGKSKKSPRGPDDRPAETILTIVQIFRNWSMWPPNLEALSKEPRVTDVITRLCSLEDDPYVSSLHPPSSQPRPLSPVLTLTEFVRVHDHATHFLANLADQLKFDTLLPQTPPRIFRLAATYLTSATAALSPLQTAQPLPRSRAPGEGPIMPPAASDLAADLFSRFTHLDEHRKVLSKVIHTEEIMTLYNALTRMLPVSREDYSIMSSLNSSREPWVGYAERVMLSMYSLIFLAPPDVKRRMNQPGIASVITRLARYYMKCVTPEGDSFLPRYDRGTQHPFMVISRRGMEALRLLDAPADCFGDDAASSAASATAGGGSGFPTFGVGYGEPDAMGFKAGDEGVGMLAGARQSVLEEMMCCPGVEDEFFSEIESLVRLGNVYEVPTLATAVM